MLPNLFGTFLRSRSRQEQVIEAQLIPVSANHCNGFCRDLLIAHRLIAEFFDRSQVYRAIVAGFLRVPELEVEDDLAIDLLIVSTEGRRCELEDLLGCKAVPDLAQVVAVM